MIGSKKYKHKKTQDFFSDEEQQQSQSPHDVSNYTIKKLLALYLL